MRVIAGAYRGRTLAAPAGLRTRPITDRAKESLFNILGSRLDRPGTLPDVDVLDLFAGCGSLGIEALSRGARSCLFVERDRAALAALRRNVTALGLGERGRIAAENAWSVDAPAPGGEGFGVVFLDPPYRDVNDGGRLRERLASLAPRLAADGLIVLRHGHETHVSLDGLGSLEVVDAREIGSMRIVLLGRAASGRHPAP